MIEAFLLSKFGPIGAKLAEYGIAFAVLAGAVWFAYAWAYDRGIASQTAIVAQAHETEQRALDANKTNAATIGTLTAENRACVASVAAGKAAAASAAAALANDNARRESTATQQRHAREVIYAHDPSAAAWSREPVPAALAEQLRQ